MDKRSQIKKILLVDDDEEFLAELGAALNEAGYLTKALNSGDSVLKVADEMQPDIILLDMKLGSKSGFQVADELKNSSQTREIPIVAMTAYFTEKAQQSVMKNVGIADVLIKPFHPVDLISKIEWLTK